MEKIRKIEEEYQRELDKVDEYVKIVSDFIMAEGLDLNLDENPSLTEFLNTIKNLCIDLGYTYDPNLITIMQNDTEFSYGRVIVKYIREETDEELEERKEHSRQAIHKRYKRKKEKQKTQYEKDLAEFERLKKKLGVE